MPNPKLNKLYALYKDEHPDILGDMDESSFVTKFSDTAKLGKLFDLTNETDPNLLGGLKREDYINKFGGSSTPVAQVNNASQPPANNTSQVNDYFSAQTKQMNQPVVGVLAPKEEEETISPPNRETSIQDKYSKVDPITGEPYLSKNRKELESELEEINKKISTSSGFGSDILKKRADSLSTYLDKTKAKVTLFTEEDNPYEFGMGKIPNTTERQNEGYKENVERTNYDLGFEAINKSEEHIAANIEYANKLAAGIRKQDPSKSNIIEDYFQERSDIAADIEKNKLNEDQQRPIIEQFNKKWADVINNEEIKNILDSTISFASKIPQAKSDLLEATPNHREYLLKNKAEQLKKDATNYGGIYELTNFFGESLYRSGIATSAEDLSAALETYVGVGHKAREFFRQQKEKTPLASRFDRNMVEDYISDGKYDYVLSKDNDGESNLQYVVDPKTGNKVDLPEGLTREQVKFIKENKQSAESRRVGKSIAAQGLDEFMQELPGMVLTIASDGALANIIKSAKIADKAGKANVVQKGINSLLQAQGAAKTTIKVAAAVTEFASGSIEGTADSRDQALKMGLKGPEVTAWVGAQQVATGFSDAINPMEMAWKDNPIAIRFKDKAADYAAGKITKLDLFKETGAGLFWDIGKNQVKEWFSEGVVEPIVQNVGHDVSDKLTGANTIESRNKIDARSVETAFWGSLVASGGFGAMSGVKIRKDPLMLGAIDYAIKNPEAFNGYAEGLSKGGDQGYKERANFFKGTIEQVKEAKLSDEDKTKAAALIFDRQSASLEADRIAEKYGPGAPLVVSKQKEIGELSKQIADLFDKQDTEETSAEIATAEGATNGATVAPISKKVFTDFDNTLFDPKTGQLTALGNEMKDRIANGEDIDILTAREDTPENRRLIANKLGIDPAKIQMGLTPEGKAAALKAHEGEKVFYDDNKDNLAAAQGTGAEVVDVGKGEAGQPSKNKSLNPGDKYTDKKGVERIWGEDINADKTHEIEQMLQATADGAAMGATIQSAEDLIKGKEIIFRRPASIEAAQNNDSYNVEILPDGSAKVIGVLDPRNNEWIGTPISNNKPEKPKPTEKEAVDGQNKPVSLPAQKEDAALEEVEPIKQLGTGANVYFESNKHRVNDGLKNGKILLNVGSNDSEVPMANIEFDNAAEAVAVAKELDRIYPKGVPDAVLIDKAVDNIRKELKAAKPSPSGTLAPKPEIKPDKAPDQEAKAHKDNIVNKFSEEFGSKGIPKKQIDAALGLMEARAKSWASEKPGRNPDEWYDRIADVKSGEFEKVVKPTEKEKEAVPDVGSDADVVESKKDIVEYEKKEANAKSKGDESMSDNYVSVLSENDFLNEHSERFFGKKTSELSVKQLAEAKQYTKDNFKGEGYYNEEMDDYVGSYENALRSFWGDKAADQSPSPEVNTIEEFQDIKSSDINSVRDLANLDAEEQSGLLSGAVFSELKKGDVLSIGGKKYTVTTRTKPTENTYYTKNNKKVDYKKSTIRLVDEKGVTISGEFWEYKNGSGNWLGKGQTRKSDKWGNLSRNIEGDITVDLINENNKFHTPSDSYKKAQAFIDNFNKTKPTPKDPTPKPKGEATDKAKIITDHLPKAGELKGVTEVNVSDNGEEVSYGTKASKTSITVKGLSAEEIKNEIDFEKKVIARSKRDAENFNEDEIRSAKGLTWQEKEQAIKMHKQSFAINEQTEKIVIPFYEKHLELLSQNPKDPNPKSDATLSLEKDLDNAQKEVKSAKDKLKAKREKLTKTKQKDAEDLFGERESEEDKKLFDERAAGDIEKLLDQEKRDVAAAETKADKLKDKLEESKAIEDPTLFDKPKDKISEIDKEINDIWNYFNNLGISVTPEQQAKDLELGIRLATLYIKKGVYKLSDIVQAGIEKLGEVKMQDILPFIKNGYLAYQGNATDEELDKMDDLKTVRNFKIEEKKETLKPEKNDKTGGPKLGGRKLDTVGQGQQKDLFSDIEEKQPTDNDSDQKADGVRKKPGGVQEVKRPSAGGSGGTSKRDFVQLGTPPENFTLDENSLPDTFTPSRRFNDNLDALKTLLTILKEKRYATKEEQEVLSKYVGWGGLKVVLNDLNTSWNDSDEKLRPQVQALHDIVKEIEKEGLKKIMPAIKASVLNAHYTEIGIIKAIYTGIEQLGFTGGHILDPSAGIGHFTGAMPLSIRDNSKITQVELEPLTGEILKQLYPKSTTHISGIQNANLPNNYYDLIISNVPFGPYGVVDRLFKSPLLKQIANRIHNYFFAKAIQQAKEGGLIAFITTSNTLDRTGNKPTRQYIKDNTEFIGAIRLPESAFKGNANTSVVTDIIFLRKTSKPQTETEFLNNQGLDVVHKDTGENKRISVNEYFMNNPDNVIGEFKAGGLHRNTEMTVVAPKDINIQKEIEKIIKNSFPINIVSNQKSSPKEQEQQEQTSLFEKAKVNEIYLDQDGKYYVKLDEYGTKTPIAKTHSVKKVKDLLSLRDALQNQYEIEAEGTATDDEVEESRKQLNTAYNNFATKYGKLNKRDNQSLINKDINSFNILSLEKKDGKADIFNKRVINPKSNITSVNNIDDAIIVSENEYGRVNVDRIASLLGQDPNEVVENNYGALFYDTNGTPVSRDEYLSGNVKKKLSEAIELAKKNDLYKRNVAALTEVIPKDVFASAIEVNLGARWVPTKTYEEFINHIFNTRSSVSYSTSTDEFSVKANKTVEITNKYAVKNKDGDVLKDGLDLLDDAMHNKTTVLRKKVSSKPDRYEVMLDETATAKEKQDEIKELFKDWIWKSEQRREELGRLYNDLYNTDVKRKHDGSKLTFEGLNNIELAPHQKDAIAMLIHNLGGIVDHVVGSGKTYVLIAGAIKMKQMGLVNKPIITGLKSTIPALRHDAKTAYPGAKILVPTESDFSAKNRKKFLSKIQNNDWDLIIMSHEQFSSIPQDTETQIEIINDELAMLEEEIINTKADGKEASKQALKGLETRKQNLMKKLGELMDIPKDKEILSFKQIGIDHVMVDESQQFKNLEYSTRINKIAGLGNKDGSKRAFNMLTTARTLQKMNNGDKGLTFSSGTPISNSLVEMYLLFKYLRPNKMIELGYKTFDAWVSQFAEATTEIEFSVGDIKQNQRYRRFINLPELSMMYNEIADVRNDSNLKLPKPKPKITGYKNDKGELVREPELIAVKQSDYQLEWTKRIIDFTKQKHGQRDGALIGKGELSKKEQNAAMLMATTIGNKLSIDMRLIDKNAEDNPTGKLAAIANNAAKIYKDTMGTKGTQLIFSDIGTPKTANTVENLKGYLEDELNINSDSIELIFGEEGKRLPTIKVARQKLMEVMEISEQEADDIIYESKQTEGQFNVYAEVKKKLIENGVPADQIVFIHDYKTNAQKVALFNKVNSGEIRIVLGSTQKLGTGVNVQKKITALHHIDASWNPAAMEQRNGRGIRQGNENEEVAIYYYGTERTLDAYKYQLIATKQRFIDQIKSGSLEGERSAMMGDGEDLGAQARVAILSGNPLLMELAKIDDKVQRLVRSRRSFDGEQQATETTRNKLRANIPNIENEIKQRENDFETVVKYGREENGRIKTIPEISTSIKIENAKDLGQAIIEKKNEILKKPLGHTGFIGKINGLELYGTSVSTENVSTGIFNDVEIKLHLKGEYQYPVTSSADPTGQGVSIGHALNRMEENLSNRKEDLVKSKANLVKFDDFLKAEWPKQDELTESLAKQKEINAQLQAQIKKPEKTNDDFTENINKGENYGFAKNSPNQDAAMSFSDGENKVNVVIDGMGGHEGGSEAANVIGRALSDKIDGIDLNQSEDVLVREIKRIVSEIQQEVIKRVPYNGGAAVTFSITKPNGVVIIASMGDTRAYVIKKEGTIYPATIDNESGYGATSVEEVGRKRGTEAQQLDNYDKESNDRALNDKFKRRNIVDNVFVSNERNVINPGITILKLNEGDNLVLTSDGVHDNLTLLEIRDAFVKGGAEGLLNTAVERSKNYSHVRNKPDDISVSHHKILIKKDQGVDKSDVRFQKTDEDQKTELISPDDIKEANAVLKSRKIEGGLLTEKQADDLQKEIESKYNPNGRAVFGQDNEDIRTNAFNYEHPLAQKTINGVDVRISEGLTEGKPYSGNRRTTYLLHADGKLVGKFYSVKDAKDVVDYIEKNLIKSIESTKFQLDADGNPKGATESLNDGRKVIVAYPGADFSTMVHELAHIFEGDLTEAERKTMQDIGGSEAFAESFETYIYTGEAPTPKLKALFNKFKQWMADIYRSIKGSPIENTLRPDVKQIFDRLLTEAKKPSLLSNPIDITKTQSEKADALRSLSEENKIIIDKFLENVDDQLGTKSGSSFKTKEGIIAKANRPSIQREKPGFDVEHVRDSFRFKTVINSLDQLKDILNLIQDSPFEIVKIDFEKLFNPKEWGWRIPAIDLRMPNGQIVEYYFPIDEIEKAKKNGNHSLFEKWRNVDLYNASNEELKEYNDDAAISNNNYQKAWEDYLKREGLSEIALRAKFDQWLKSLADVDSDARKLSFKSSADGAPLLQLEPSNTKDTKSIPPRTQARPSSVKDTLKAEVVSIPANIKQIPENAIDQSPVIYIPGHRWFSKKSGTAYEEKTPPIQEKTPTFEEVKTTNKDTKVESLDRGAKTKTLAKGVRKAYRNIKNKRYLQALAHKVSEAEDLAMKALIGGAKLHIDVLKIIFKDQREELKSRIWLQDNVNGFKTITAFAHHLFQIQEDEFGSEKFDDLQLRNAAETIIRENEKLSKIVDKLNDRYRDREFEGRDPNETSTEEKPAEETKAKWEDLPPGKEKYDALTQEEKDSGDYNENGEFTRFQKTALDPNTSESLAEQQHKKKCK